MTEPSEQFLGEQCPRLVVVQCEGPDGYRELDAAVAATTYVRDGEWWLSLIVKLALQHPEEGDTLAPAPAPAMRLDLASRFSGASELLDHASDFALYKQATDVVIVGHAYASSASDTLPISVRIDSAQNENLLFQTAVLRAGAPATQLPLIGPYLSPAWGGTITRLAPSRNELRFVRGHPTPGSDPDLFQAAPPEMRIDRARATDAHRLCTTGLFARHAGREQTLLLPRLAPVITCDVGDLEALPVPAFLDTIAIDSDSGAVTLTWRATWCLVTGPDSLRRFVVSLERVGQERSPGERLSDAQRGSVRFAWTEEDAQKGTPPPTDDPTLELHRHLTWGEVAPEPRITLERYALISAALAEWPDKRAHTLEQHGFDEERFMLEERCWLERFAADVTNGQGALPMLYGDMFVAEQDKLATPEEAARTLSDYLAILMDVERFADVVEALSQHKLGLSAWMRLDRRWQARAEQDPAVRAEIDAALAAVRDEPHPLDDLPEDP